jgi:hypothetical protein
MLKIRGSRVRSLQFMQFLDFVQDNCLWFPEAGTVNLETWSKVGDGLRAGYVAEGLECRPIFIFALWSLIKDCLGPTPSHRASSLFKLECGAHFLQSARQYPLKENHAVGREATELWAPPCKDVFT